MGRFCFLKKSSEITNDSDSLSETERETEIEETNDTTKGGVCLLKFKKR